MQATQAVSRQRLAELSSAVGAGVIGLGLGALLASSVRALAVPILLAGLLMHAWGMTDKHRLENVRGEQRPWWSTTLYWVCWLGLAALTLVVVVRAVQ